MKKLAITVFIFGLLACMLSAVPVSIDIKKEAYDFDAVSAFGSYNLLQPKEALDDYYDLDISFSAGLGITYFKKEKEIMGFRIPKMRQFRFIEFSKSDFEIKDEIDQENPKAELMSWHLSKHHYLKAFSKFNFVVGTASGVSKFTLDQDTFDSFGHTYTELGIENEEWQFSTIDRMGLNFEPFDMMSFEAIYEMNTVDKEFKVFRAILSSIIKDLLTGATYSFMYHESVDEKISEPTKNLLIFCVHTGANFLWTELDTEKHNWPFDDKQPLRFDNIKLGIKFNFR